jgi:hypothetical protein
VQAGGGSFWKREMTAPTALLRRQAPTHFGYRPVTDESRLVTAPILLVNARVRKHWIPVSGVTRRTLRRAATRPRDERLRGHETRDFRDERSVGAKHRGGAPSGVNRHSLGTRRTTINEGLQKRVFGTSCRCVVPSSCRRQSDSAAMGWLCSSATDCVLCVRLAHAEPQIPRRRSVMRELDDITGASAGWSADQLRRSDCGRGCVGS